MLTQRVQRFLLVSTLLLVFSHQSVAIEILKNQFVETQWLVESVLPQKTITSIVQTKDGYLWLSTFGGLARFDGVNFKVFTTSVVPELMNNRLVKLLAGSDGSLWIGAEDGEIFVLKNNKFNLVDNGKLRNNQMVTELYESLNGKIWVGSENGLSSCNYQSCKKEILSGRVDEIREDLSGNIWIRSEFRLLLFRNGDLSQGKFILDDIKSFEVMPDNSLLIIRNNEIGFYKEDHYRKFLSIPESEVFPRIDKDIQGNTWIFLSSLFLKLGGNDVVAYQVPKFEGLGFWLIDREENFWFAGQLDKISKLNKRKIFTLFESKTNQINQSYSIIEDANGWVWISTQQGLMKWKNGISLSDTTLPNLKNDKQGVLSLGHDGTIWFLRWDGLYRLTENKAELVASPDNLDATGFGLFEDSQGYIWFGSRGSGLFRFDKKATIQKFTTTDGLTGDSINTIFEDSKKTLWFGTRTGLSKLNDNKFTNYTMLDGLSNNNIRDIYEDQDGTLWIGTYGGGLNRLKNEKITSITTKQGLYDDVVSKILIDDFDNFWMLGNRGIFSISRQALNEAAEGIVSHIYCKIYNSADGMKTSEGNGQYQNSGIRTKDGKMWFSTIDGVVILSPNQEQNFLTTPLIEEVSIGNQPLDFSNQIELLPNHNEIEIKFTGISFIKPEQIRFRYRIKGLDDKWTDIGTRRTAYISRIPPGNYQFQVAAANADGVWNTHTADLSITVNPFFYDTIWAKIGAGLLILFFFTAFYFGLTRYFRHQQKNREDFAQRLIQAQEEERLNLASEIHDGLGQLLLIIKNWTDLSFKHLSSSNKLYSYLEQIAETSSVALDEIRSLAKELHPYHLKTAGLTKTLSFMIKRVENSTNIEFSTEIDNIDKLLNTESEINLYRIIQEALNNIVKHSQATRSEISLKLKGTLITLEISDNGKGFNQAAKNYQSQGIGLNGINERARMLGATWKVKSVPNQGTKIFLEFKINEKNIKKPENQ